jgi:hypothetical protein
MASAACVRLAPFIASFLLAACGGGSSDSPDPPSGEPDSPPEPPPVTPKLPANIEVHAGDGEVVVNWTEKPDLTYTVYWSTTPGLPLEDRTAVENLTTRFRHTGLTNGTTYYYVVQTIRDGVASPASLEYEAIPGEGIDIFCNRPRVDELVQTNDEARCGAESTFELARLSVRVGDEEVDLMPTPEPCDPVDEYCGLRAPLPLPDDLFGHAVLVVTAVDVTGTTVRDSYSIVRDELPVVELEEPADYEIARPELHVRGSCTDDAPRGCTSVRVRAKCDEISPILVEVDGAAIDEDVSFQPVDGCKATLELDAFDPAGQRSERATRTVYVESSQNLMEVAQVPGPIWDVDADRMLYVDASGGYEVLKIRDRALGTDEIVLDDPGATLDNGRLAPRGAIFVALTPDLPAYTVLEWRDGSLIALDEPDPIESLDVAGDYAIWHSGQDSGTITRRDLQQGTNILVTEEAGTGGPGASNVAADGDVVFFSSSSYDIFRYDDEGGLEQLTDDPDDVVRNIDPVTDGNIVVYRKAECCISEFDVWSIAVHDGTSETVLTTEPSEDAPQPDADYTVAGGWVAFTDVGPSGTRQVSVRAPDGTVTRVSFFTETTSIEALGADGAIAFTHDGRRYLGVPPFAGVSKVSSDLRDGPVFWDGSLFVTIGRYLFAVAP